MKNHIQCYEKIILNVTYDFKLWKHKYEMWKHDQNNMAPTSAVFVDLKETTLKLI
jgi:hypothetical protein